MAPAVSIAYIMVHQVANHTKKMSENSTHISHDTFTYKTTEERRPLIPPLTRNDRRMRDGAS